MWGFFARDQDSKLQGFITFTTFTNWQKSFRWDSIHESAYSYDDPELAQEMLDGERQYDESGSLARELQQTVRCGDPWNEGIVWPRIAEISLLGGLGCGRNLLSLAIEQLETMKATSKQNYDYVVLQATENSIPFYESMGFTRVGAVTVDEHCTKKPAATRRNSDSTVTDDDGIAAAVPVDASSPPSSEVVSSPTTIYIVETPGETPIDVAKKCRVQVWDVVFLNHYIYKDLNSRSRLMKGTKLYIPAESKAQADASSLVRGRKDLENTDKSSDAWKWYIARENDTPKMIAKTFGVNCQDLIAANLERLPELQAISRLKEGTRVRVSHLDEHDDRYVPYCHWTFPDDKFEHGEPSYMMARKLNRQPNSKLRPVASSLAVPISKYVRPPSSLFHEATIPVKSADKKSKKPSKADIQGPGKPKRPLSAYMIYCNEQRDSLNSRLAGKPASEFIKILSARWKELRDEEKAEYQKKQEAAKKKYDKALKKYENDLARFFAKHPEMKPKDDDYDSADQGTLFNKVVTVKSGVLGDAHKDFKYFYVLTFIPDLFWCHLAPMRQVGYWGEDKPKCEGRPIWMLVDESKGLEVDVSGSFCYPVRSRALRRTADADEEQWDVVESGPSAMFLERASSSDSSHGSTKPAALDTKPSAVAKSVQKVKKRKREDPKSKEGPFPGPDTMEESPRVRGVFRELPPRRAAPIFESDELPQLPKKRKGGSSAGRSESADKKVRGVHRELPPRKAAPTQAGDFAESPSGLPPRAAPRKTIQKNAWPPHKVKAPVVPPKRRGRPQKQQSSPARESPTTESKETPLKPPSKKGRPSKRARETDESPAEDSISSRSRGRLRELPRRKAAPSTEGFFKESPSGKPRKVMAFQSLPREPALPLKETTNNQGSRSKKGVEPPPSKRARIDDAKNRHLPCRRAAPILAIGGSNRSLRLEKRLEMMSPLSVQQRLVA
jgi:hypothetical protein